MAPKSRSKSSLDADAVARMMREQDEGSEPAPSREDAPAVSPAELEPTSPKLQAEPETPAPVAPEPVQAEPPAPPPSPEPDPTPSMLGPRPAPAFDPGQVDGRTLRRTGREPFATRIKPEAHAALKRIAYTRGITIAEALETAVAEFERR